MYRINLCNVFKINLRFCKGNTGTQIEQQLSGADKILVSRQSETFFSRDSWKISHRTHSHLHPNLLKRFKEKISIN